MLNLGVATNTVGNAQLLNLSSSALKKHMLVLVALVSWFQTSVGLSTTIGSENPAYVEFEQGTRNTKPRTRTIVESAHHVGPAIVADAVYIDTIGTFLIVLLTAGSTSAAVASLPVTLVPALIGYGIRKTCNDQLNPGEFNPLCGVIGGGTKGAVKHIGTILSFLQRPTYLGLFTSFIYLAQGAMDGALYEYFLPTLIRLTDENSYIQAIGVSSFIEILNAFAVTYAKYLEGDPSVLADLGQLGMKAVTAPAKAVAKKGAKTAVNAVANTAVAVNAPIGVLGLASKEAGKAVGASGYITTIIGTIAKAHENDFKPFFVKEDGTKKKDKDEL